MLPDVPTAKEDGLDYQMSIWAGIFAPKNTPQPIVDKLAAALDKTLDDAAVKAKVTELGGSIPPKSERTSAKFNRFVKAEIARWSPILKAASAETGTAGQLGAAGQPGQRGQPVGPGAAGQPGQPGQPAGPGAAGQPEQPGQPARPGAAWQPGERAIIRLCESALQELTRATSWGLAITENRNGALCRTGRIAEADSDLHRRSDRKDRARGGGCIRPREHRGICQVACAACRAGRS